MTYTAKGNLVAVISNGTAILGLGNLGALASKPVMEGKAVLFKRFADVDSIDIELDTEDAQRFIEAVALMEPSFGGINLEDIAAPDCFIIEQALHERMNIPVFHDDQHGTAIITAAGLINACFLTGREFKDIKVVVNGAGAAAIACTELIKAMGVRARQRHHVRPQGRDLSRAATTSTSSSRRMRSPTEARTLEGGAGRRRRVPRPVGARARSSRTWSRRWRRSRSSSPWPIPIPRSRPPDAKAARPDAIVATGRSDYPNQVNNVLGFPFIFRGALDVRATGDQRGDEDRRRPCAGRAGARGGARGSRRGLWRGQPQLRPRLHHPRAVRSAADGGRPLRRSPRRRWTPASRRSRSPTWTPIARRLRARLNPTASVLSLAYEAARANPKRVLFAEGEEENVLRAAIAFRDGGYGTPVLVGREDVYDKLARARGRRSAEL